MTPFSPSENPLTESSRIPVLSPSPSSSSVQRGQREVEDQGVEEREERLETLCIPQAAFVRLVEEITSEVEIEGKPVQGIDWQPLALLALQEAAEAFLIDLLKNCALCANHADRVMIQHSDFQRMRQLMMAFGKWPRPASVDELGDDKDARSTKHKTTESRSD